jgi:hypothetical protein
MNNLFKKLLMIISLCTIAYSQTIPFDLNIKGHGEDITKKLMLSDIGEGKTKINFDFKLDGKKYNFDLKSVKLPSNRSYPTNLDITIKDANGKKLGYIFYANNGVHFLKQMGEFGLIINVLGKPVDFKFIFDKNKKSNYSIANLGTERFVQDTLVPKFGFQMIRPVVLPKISQDVRSQTYSLDHHPYSINYTLKNIDNGLVQFQHNLYSNKNGKVDLLERFYFNVDNLDTLRESMYAVKYFNKHAGTFKLVYYAASGQLTPAK